MREIKFRIWGKREKEMFYQDTVEMLTFSSKNKTIGYRDAFAHFKHRYKKMLYTGLKGKNGKEIYEGDIVKISTYLIYRIGVVIFYQGEWCIKQPNNLIYSLRDYFGNDSKLEIEVIGNKYEDGDLIECS